jgi:hypothetical protein
LESEINGYVNPQDGTEVYKGFTKQNLSIILKYELKELGETLKAERTKIESLRDELILKYGEKDEKNGVMVKMYNETRDDEGKVLTRVVNPQYVEFDKEYGILLDQEKEIEYPEITKDDLKEAGKSSDNYIVLFKLVKKEVKKEGTN